MQLKRHLSLPIVAGALLTLGAALTANPQGAAAQSKDFAWPTYFNVITPQVGTANHSLAVAWSPEFTAKTGVRVRVLPTPNGYARTEWLNTGEGLLSLYQPSDYFDQMDGVEGYASPNAGPSDTRLVNVNLVTAWGYMVRGDSPIQTIEDVKPGAKVVFYTGSSFISNGMKALLAYRNLKMEDISLVEVGSYGANTKVVVEGRGDVTFTSPISGPSYEAEAAPSKIRWLAIPPKDKDPAAFARYRALQAGYVLQKTVSGTKSAIGVAMDHAVQANHALASLDPEFVYRLVKWMDENHDSYKDKFQHAKMMTVGNLVGYLDTGSLVPLHTGTIKYLTEKGQWKPSYQARQDALVALAEKRVALFKGALDAAKAKNLKPDPGNAEWQKFWTSYRNDKAGGKSYGEVVQALE